MRRVGYAMRAAHDRDAVRLILSKTSTSCPLPLVVGVEVATERRWRVSSFEEAYARLYPTVVRSAWSICRDAARAEELAQEAFVRAYRRWSRLQDSGYVEPWLHRTAMNLALSHVQRAGRGRVLEAFGLAMPAQCGGRPMPAPWWTCSGDSRSASARRSSCGSSPTSRRRRLLRSWAAPRGR